MNKRLGKQTVLIEDAPCIFEQASIAGPTEGQGPLGAHFDIVLDDDIKTGWLSVIPQNVHVVKL